MSTTVIPEAAELRRVVKVSAKPAWAMGILFAIVGLILVFAPRDGDTRFRFSEASEKIVLPSLTVPGMPTAWGALAVAAMALVVTLVLLRSQRRTPVLLVVVFGVALMTAFMSWAGAGGSGDFNVTTLLSNSILAAVPLIFGAMGGVMSERAGVVNIAIEGQLLGGAFSAAFISSLTDNPWIGLLAAVLAGVFVSWLLVVFAINNRVEQVIVGVVVNVLIVGLTSFLYSQLLQSDPARFNSSARFPVIPIPLVSDIPILGPALFRQTILVYALYLIVPGVWFLLFRTKWGLRVRAVGEHPKAADTVGINVNGIRRQAVYLGGAIAGLGGAYYTLVAVSQFGKEMTGGAGYIALAAVIFGKWHPLYASGAALLFGFATALQRSLTIVGSPVPSQFMLMLPYLVTLAAVAGLVGRSRAPAADGTPYVKE